MNLCAWRSIRVEAGARCILDLPELGVREGAVLGVLGPSGAGKSTLLRVAALVLRPEHGVCLWRGEALAWPAPLEVRRRITMVFQDPILFSDTTLNNVLYGLSLRGVGRREARGRALEMLQRLGIADRAHQAAHTLSGGEAQRVALARAFVTRPELLLLDEPLAAVDAPFREELRAELLALVRQCGTTCVWVTHDRDEARVVADEIAVLHAGRLRQWGAPEEVFSRPADAFVARFVGTTNILPGSVVARRDGVLDVAVDGQTLSVRGALEPGCRVLVCVRPEEVGLTRDAPSEAGAAARLSGTVTSVVQQASDVEVRLACGFPLVARVSKPLARRIEPKVGEPIGVSLPHDVVHLIEEQRQC